MKDNFCNIEHNEPNRSIWEGLDFDFMHKLLFDIGILLRTFNSEILTPKWLMLAGVESDLSEST